MPFLNQLVEDYSGNDEVIFLAPALSDSEKIKRMLTIRDFNYLLIPDAVDMATKLGIGLYPTHMVLNPEGEITFIETGYHSDTEEKLRSHLQENGF